MKRLAWFILLGLTLSFWESCVISEPTFAPPPLQTEVFSVSPSPDHVWIGGYWRWSGAKYVWVPGYWAKPRPGHAWVPGHWERHGRHWVWRPGHWRRI